MVKKNYSLAEYWGLRNLWDFDRVRVVQSGVTSGLDGRIAQMWGRHILFTLKEAPDEHPNVHEAVKVDANNNRIQFFLPGILPNPVADATVSHVEIYGNNCKLEITGTQAAAWWGMAVELLKRSPFEKPDLYQFCKLKADGTLELPDLDKLIGLHVLSTGFCSFAGHMRSCSASYKAIMEIGTAAVPAILKYLQANQAGMNTMMLLEDITKERPFKPDRIKGTDFVAINVKSYRQAWLDWGKERGLT